MKREQQEKDTRIAAAPVRPQCGGCTPVSRRGVLGGISAAALAAMVGVELWPSTAAALPVVDSGFAQGAGNELSLPLPPSDGVTIDRDAQVILVRFQGYAYVFNLACPHENTALRWREKDVRFQCPRHESKYQADGTFTEGRATRNMDRFALKRAGNALVVDLGRLYRSDQNPQEWSAAKVKL
jgi:nitrite reductase/ring-hydroxylating ferredoxin subunit